LKQTRFADDFRPAFAGAVSGTPNGRNVVRRSSNSVYRCDGMSACAAPVSLILR